jgi:cadmium resistance protein CadD (predicted permease)
VTWFLSAVVVGIVTFVVTNMDDVLVLAILFGQSNTNPALRKRFVVLGQYLGFQVLVLASLLVALTSLVIPLAWIGLLGIFPIGQGMFRLIMLARQRAAKPRSELEEVAATAKKAAAAEPRLVLRLLDPRIYSVAAITISNGSDNISIYRPIFAHGGYGRLAVVLVIFFLMVALWCALGNLLTYAPGIAPVLERYGQVVLPLCLIGLGIFILAQSGALELFANLFAHLTPSPL